MYSKRAKGGVKDGLMAKALRSRYIKVLIIVIFITIIMLSGLNMSLMPPSAILLRQSPESNANTIKRSTKQPFYPRVVHNPLNRTIHITIKKMEKVSLLQTIKISESNIDSLCNECYYNGTTQTSAAQHIDICIPMTSWQTQMYPSCNTVHELDLLYGIITSEQEYDDEWKEWSPKVRLLGKGGSRLALRIKMHIYSEEPDDAIEELALKVLRIDREFDPENFENQRVDAIVSERLTSAPDVMDIYGFCGTSALNELSSGLDLRQLVRKKSFWHPSDILEMVLQASTSLARVHSIDYADTNATLVHNDLSQNNYVISKLGRLKLTDFNLSILLRWNITSKKSCGFLQRRFGGASGIHVSSPPEALLRNTTLLSEKVDIYGLGTLIFQYLTGHQVYDQELFEMGSSRQEVAKVLQLVTSPVHPLLPEMIENSNDTIIIGLKAAMRQALQFSPENRPTAQELVNCLKAIYDDPTHQDAAREKLLLKLRQLIKQPSN